MSSRAAWRWCFVAGLVAFACSWGFGRIPGLVACGDTGGLGPIIAFEFARTPAELAAVFGAEPCRSTLVAAQRTGLWLDALGFIPSYTAFLCLAVWAAGGGLRRWIVAALLIAGCCDEIEGVVLFAILHDLPGTPALLDTLWWPVHTKFWLLATGTGAIGLKLILAHYDRDWKLWLPRLLLALPISLGAAIALDGLRIMPDWRFPSMMSGFTLAWSTLLLVAAIGAVWPRLLAPRPPAPAPPSA